MKTVCCVQVVLWLFVTGWGLGARAATFELRVEDERGVRLPCRVHLQDEHSSSVVPKGDGVVTVPIGPQTWFVTGGEVRIPNVSGNVELRVERGLEFVRYRERLEINENPELVKHTVVLKRWIHMRERGYLCGENHLHVDARSLGPMAVAEGLDFGSSLTWWNGADPRRPVLGGEGKFRSLAFAGSQVTASIYDAELEYGWGAAYLQALPAPLPLPPDPARPNLFALRHAVDHGALVHYQGGWSREVGLNALLGLVDTVNVCNNNFHLHKFQPRQRYSNLLGVDGFPSYPDTERGMLDMNTETYYRLLNWGLQIAAGAGSATGAKSTPVGYNRAYVRVPAEASLISFNEAWRRGANFVTNGPMLFLAAEENARPGETIDLGERGRSVPVRIEVHADQPIESVELVLNGEVVREWVAFEKKVPAVLEARVPIRRGGWLAARCTTQDAWLTDEELAIYRRDSNLAEEPSRLRFAHTSPIYFTVGGRAARVRSSLEEGMQMMEALKKYGESHAGAAYRDAFGIEVDRARTMLEQRLAGEVAFEHPLRAPGVTSLTDPEVSFETLDTHEVVLQRGDVTAVVVDNEALPERGHLGGYSGLASLTHQDREANVFVPAYSGLNFEHIHDGTTQGLVEPFEPRRFPMQLRRIDEHTVELYQAPTGNWQLESCARFHMLEDGFLEYTFECIPRSGAFAQEYIGLFWASYIEQPESKKVHFRGRSRANLNAPPQWIEALSPSHGVASTHGPWQFPNLPEVDDDFPLTLVNHASSFLYEEPWYFGVSHGMALAFLFRDEDRIWFAQSPSGGGEGNPAWDFQWFVPDYEVGQAYGFVMRLAYLPFEDRDLLETRTRRHREALNKK